MTYSTYSPEYLELFFEADMESEQIESLDLEGLESLAEENLESISVEKVAEEVEYEAGYASSSYMIRRLTKIFTHLVKQAIKKITMNPRTQSKLHAACRKGPDSVTKLITPIVAKPLPSYFKFLATTFCPLVVARLFPSIAKEARLKPEEIEAATELW